MKAYHCEGCGSLVFFDNVSCIKRGRVLGFLPDYGELSALEPAENGHWKALRDSGNPRLYRSCNNGQQHQICNWLVAAEDANPFCVSCRLNETIPNLEVAGNRSRWHRLEQAKRRLIYTILSLGLPMGCVPPNSGPGDQRSRAITASGQIEKSA